MQSQENFLCPVNLESLIVKGQFNSETFTYVEIQVQGCQLESGCLEDEELAKQTISFLMLQTYPNILGEDITEYYTQVTDDTMFYYLDPTHR